MKMLTLFSVFRINHCFKFFRQYFLYFPAHSEKLVFITLDFSPHLFSFPSLFFPSFYSHRRKRTQEIGKRSIDDPTAILPGSAAPHKCGLLLSPKGRELEEAACTSPGQGAGCSSWAVWQGRDNNWWDMIGTMIWSFQSWILTGRGSLNQFICLP